MLLAIDTSTAQSGLALYDGMSIPAEFVWRSGLHHTQELAPGLADLLDRVDIKMEAVTALGVAIGPGSFTSLRRGIGVCKRAGACTSPAGCRHPHAGHCRRGSADLGEAVGGCSTGRTRPSGTRLV